MHRLSVLSRIACLCLSLLLAIAAATWVLNSDDQSCASWRFNAVLLSVWMVYALASYHLLSPQLRSWLKASAPQQAMLKAQQLYNARGRMAIEELASSVSPPYQQILENALSLQGADSTQLVLMHMAQKIRFEIADLIAWVQTLKEDGLGLCLFMLCFQAWSAEPNHAWTVDTLKWTMTFLGAMMILEGLSQSLLCRIDRAHKQAWMVLATYCGIEQGSARAYLALWGNKG